MSLQVWLPFIKDNSNYGINKDITISGGGISGSIHGKIGNYCMDSSSTMTVTCPYMSGKKVWSVCFWGYIDSSQITANWTGILHLKDGGSSLRLEVCPSTNYNGIYCYSLHNNSAHSIISVAISSPTGGYYDQWAHVCITSDGKTITKYVNGIKNGTAAYNGSGTITGVFLLQNNQKIHKNDFRVYDHTLTIKEIKEIYKHPIVHFDFEKITPVISNDILSSTKLTMGSLTASVSGSISKDIGAFKFTTSGSGTTRLLIPLNLLTTNTVYRTSCIVQCPSGATFTLSDWCDSGTVTNKKVRRIGTDRYFLTMDVSRSSYDSTYRFFDWVASAAGTYEISEFKMCPISGYKMNDCSGYNNDAENHGVTLTGTTPLGFKAGQFQSNTYLKFLDPFKEAFSEASWSFWIQLDNSNSNIYRSIYHAFNSPTSTMWISLNTEGAGLWFYRGGYVTASSLLSANVFYHVALTYKKGTFHWYLNGVEQSLTKVTYTNSTIPVTTYVSIGDSYSGSSWDGTPFVGKIADFKIYPVELSAEDIAAEYKTRVQIARDSTLFVNNACETGDISDNTVFKYTGTLEASGISEYDMKVKFDPEIYFEPDGSAWVRISHHANPASGLFSSSDDFANSCYKDANRWFNCEVFNYLNKWEIMAKQKATSTSSEVKFRWVQNVNPLLGTFEETTAAKISLNNTAGYSSTSYGGIYKINSSTYICANNGHNGNWFGAIGSWSSWNGGIPGWNGTAITTGYLDCYVRIDNDSIINDSGTNFKSFNKGTVYTKNLIEY